MTKIYTKKGDKGDTSLRAGKRVDKDDIRIEANGEMDELDAWLGLIAAESASDKMTPLQVWLYKIMAGVANDFADWDDERLHELDDFTRSLEAEMDLSASSQPFAFVLPGGSRLKALLHLARTKTRTTERRMVTLRRQYPVPDEVMSFLNRLSDYLFMLANKE